MAVFSIFQSEHLQQIGYYRGPTGMQCIRHAERGRGMRRDAQPMMVADVKYEGYDPEKPWDWCPQCAVKWGRQNGHEYVVQRGRGALYEVIDLTLPYGDFAVHQSTSTQDCYDWIEGKGRHEINKKRVRRKAA